MTSRAPELLQEALTLPLEERADVAAEPLASLDETPATTSAELEDDAGLYMHARESRVTAAVVRLNQ